MSEQETASNLAARVLYDAALAGDLRSSQTSLESIPQTAAEAIHVWATQRDVPLEAIERRGGELHYADRAVYCFAFRTNDRFAGVVCVDADGTVLAEDSRVSACR